MRLAGKEADTLITGPLVDPGLKSVLVATDLSPISEKPVRRAIVLARYFGAKFYLAHVVSSLGYTIAGAEAMQLAFDSAFRDVEQLKHRLLENGCLNGLEHEFLLRQGQVWHELDAIIREKHIDIVVVGTRGRRNLEKVVLGSVAEQIFRHADCMVLTVGPQTFEDSPLQAPRSVQSILLATDFGPASCRALKHAIPFANHFGVKLVMLHVAPIAPIPEGFHWSQTSGDVRKLQDDERWKSIAQMEKMVAANAPLNMPPEFLVKFGTPSKVILHVARELNADLIVMGLNRTLGIAAASHTPWATAHEVVGHAGCSVLTVRS